MIRVMIIEDHPAIADGLAALIGAEADIEIVGVAHSLETAEVMLATVHPSIVLCDVMLAGRDDGFQLLRRFGTEMRFIMLTAYDYQAHHAAAVAGRAAGYLSKLSDAATIVRTIRRVDAGESMLPAPVMESARRAPAPPTARERQLLTMLIAGASNDEIAFAMGIKVKTVEGMLRRLYDRYGTANRTQLVRFTMHQGWLTNELPTAFAEATADR